LTNVQLPKSSVNLNIAFLLLQCILTQNGGGDKGHEKDPTGQGAEGDSGKEVVGHITLQQGVDSWQPYFLYSPCSMLSVLSALR